MRLEKVSLIIVVVVLVIALAVPFWRGLAGSQIRQTAPWRAKSIWSGDTNPSIANPHPKTNAQLYRDHPRDFLLCLAFTQKFYDCSAERFKSRRGQQAVHYLMRNFPKQGIVYVLAGMLPEYCADIPFRKEGNWMTDEEAPKDWIAPPPPTRSQLDGARRYIALMDTAIAADPSNGYFHYIKALYLYGLHRDGEALREIHLSAIAPRFTDYTDLRAQAEDHLCDLHGGFDPDRRATKSLLFTSSEFSQMRNGARITGHLAYDQIRHGNTDKGVAIALDQTTAGYNMMRHAPTFIHALVGRAVLAIGARAIDPNFDSELRSVEDDRAARSAHYTRFLIDHGHSGEAAMLKNQWNTSERVAQKMRTYLDTALTQADELMYYPVVFAAGTGVLAIALVCAIGWGVGALLTMRGRAGGCWDRRAGVTSIFLAALVLAPVIVILLTRVGFCPSPLDPDKAEVGSSRAYLLLIPLAVGLAALLCGAALMLLRTPAETQNRRMPVWSLLVAYVSVAGALVYLAYPLNDLAQGLYFFQWVEGTSTGSMILYPIAALFVYGLIRAAQSRFGHIRQSVPLTFASTLRYGSALAVGMFAVVYICLLVMTAHYGAKADVAARQMVVGEAAFIQRAFRSH
jgi:hypothetical protein